MKKLVDSVATREFELKDVLPQNIYAGSFGNTVILIKSISDNLIFL